MLRLSQFHANVPDDVQRYYGIPSTEKQRNRTFRKYHLSGLRGSFTEEILRNVLRADILFGRRPSHHFEENFWRNRHRSFVSNRRIVAVVGHFLAYGSHFWIYTLVHCKFSLQEIALGINFKDVKGKNNFFLDEVALYGCRFCRPIELFLYKGIIVF